MKKNRLIKKVGIILSQLALFILVSWSLAEISLRIYNNYNPSFIFYSGSYDRFRGKPHSVNWNFQLNSDGFHDKEFLNNKASLYRILGIGDSFSFGIVPYEKNYLTLIESHLSRTKETVEIFNMGIPSIGPKDYLSLLVKEGLDFRPDMVLLSFFIGNDFNDSYKRKLYEYSYVTSLLHYIISLQPKIEGRKINQGEYCDDCPTFTYDDYLAIEYERSHIFNMEYREFPKLFGRSIYYLSQIKEICDRKGIKFIVVIIPDEIQMNHALRDAVQEKFRFKENKEHWDFKLPNELLAGELNKLEVDYIDLYDFFLAETSEPLYRPRDTHWNIKGNRLAADVIGNYLSKYLHQ